MTVVHLTNTYVSADVGLETGSAILIPVGFIVVLALGLVWAVLHGVRTVLGLSRIRMWPALTGRWLARQLRGRPAVTSASGLVHGSSVHLRGVVEADGLARAALSGRSTVVCGHAFGESGGAVLGEGMEARDFLLRLEDGTAVRVWAREAADRKLLRLVDASPHAWRSRKSMGGWFRESRVAPADEIAIVGVLEMRVDRDARRVGDRQAPVCWTVTAARGKLLLRFGTRRSRVDELGPLQVDAVA
jgi:hypothetical protein